MSSAHTFCRLVDYASGIIFGLLSVSVVSFVILPLSLSSSRSNSKLKEDFSYTNEYLIRVYSDEKVSFLKQYAERFGLTYVEQVSPNVHCFIDPIHTQAGIKTASDGIADSTLHTNITLFVEFFKHEIAEFQRVKRSRLKQVDQSHRLVSVMDRFDHFVEKREVAARYACSPYYGMDIEGAWALGFTGTGINVGILDVGMETDHPDLKQNVNTKLAHNFVDEHRRNEFSPEYDRSYYQADPIMDHGNNIAGLIASVKGNNLCSRGVAYNSSVVPLVVFKWMHWHLPDFNDKYIPAALVYKHQDIQIYSNSYNNKRPFQEPKLSMQDSLQTGVTQGRSGKGSIFVFSLGDNVGSLHDGNMDFFANSIHTITVGSIAKGGKVPEYAIPCACIIASALGEGKTLESDHFLTTSHRKGCSNEFKGCSAATAIGAGVIALGLKDKLSWRDVQYLLVLTSSLNGLKPDLQSTTNAIGFKYNPHFGYGMMNATGFALMAETWTPVPPQISSVHHKTSHERWTPKPRAKLPRANKIDFEVKGCDPLMSCINSLEHVVVYVQYKATRERLLAIQLTSPLGTRSFVLNDAFGTLPLNISEESVHRFWNFTSVQFWGENPVGNWSLILTQYDRSQNISYKYAEIKESILYIYGVPSGTKLLKEGHINTREPGKKENSEDDILDILHRVNDYDVTAMLDPESNTDVKYITVIRIVLGITMACVFILPVICLMVHCCMPKHRRVNDSIIENTHRPSLSETPVEGEHDQEDDNLLI